MNSKAARPVAIVTGSSSGVGAATVRLLSRQGWNVVVNYSRSAEAAEAVAAECRDLGAEVELCRADVTADADCRALVAAAVERWGRLDSLVNNAGATKFNDHRDLDGLDAEDFLQLYALNTVGPYQMVRAAEPHLRASDNPSVVMVASVAGVMGIGSSIAYAASKGALITMTLSLARALGPIRINAICPGFIQGEWLRRGMGEEAYQATMKALEGSTPLQMTCDPDTVADGIWYFIERARGVSGETLMMDGGMHLSMAPLGRR